jgi:serine/threonine-protein kinase
MPYAEAAHLLVPIAKALAYAHREGIIHRDVKPANILMTKMGESLLSDFGVAKILERKEETTLTGTSVGVGTPEYMAPEQWNNQVTPQTDIYALGVVFYELVTGRKPYMADTPHAVYLKQMTEPLPRPKNFIPTLPDKVEQILFKALAKDAGARYADMAAFATELEKIASVETYGRAAKPKSWGLIALGIGAAIAILLLAIVLLSVGGNKLTLLPSAASSQVASTTMDGTEIAAGVISSSEMQGTAMQMTTALYPGATRVSPKDGMPSVYIPKGEFLMGSAEGDKDAVIEEKPQHKVYLDDYWMDKTGVTNAMYRKCVDVGGCTKPRDTKYFDNSSLLDHPVVSVDWNQAQAYCKWADGRLPTEAEWEKAARGTDGGIYPWGNDPPNADLLNYNSNIGRTTAVGSYPAGASPYGIMDMAGNVWEWVSDWYDEKYYQDSPQRNPPGPASGQERVLRGGAWGFGTRDVRSAFRIRDLPDNAVDLAGFRCVRFP